MTPSDIDLEKPANLDHWLAHSPEEHELGLDLYEVSAEGESGSHGLCLVVHEGSRDEAEGRINPDEIEALAECFNDDGQEIVRIGVFDDRAPATYIARLAAIAATRLAKQPENVEFEFTTSNYATLCTDGLAAAAREQLHKQAA